MKLEELLTKQGEKAVFQYGHGSPTALDPARVEDRLRHAAPQVKAGLLKSLAEAAQRFPQHAALYNAAIQGVKNLGTAYFAPPGGSLGHSWSFTQRGARESGGGYLHGIHLYNRVFDDFRIYPTVTIDDVTKELEIHWAIGTPGPQQLQEAVARLRLEWFTPAALETFRQGSEIWGLLSRGYQVGVDQAGVIQQVYNPRTREFLPPEDYSAGWEWLR